MNAFFKTMVCINTVAIIVLLYFIYSSRIILKDMNTEIATVHKNNENLFNLMGDELRNINNDEIYAYIKKELETLRYTSVFDKISIEDKQEELSLRVDSVVTELLNRLGDIKTNFECKLKSNTDSVLKIVKQNNEDTQTAIQETLQKLSVLDKRVVENEVLAVKIKSLENTLNTAVELMKIEVGKLSAEIAKEAAEKRLIHYNYDAVLQIEKQKGKVK